MNKFWNELMKLPNVKPKVSYPKAKRSKAKLIEFADSLGLKIDFNCYGKKHGIFKKDMSESIHNNYGIQDSCYNLQEIEECLEDYASENNK